jgi:hypothetical protein
MEWAVGKRCAGGFQGWVDVGDGGRGEAGKMFEFYPSILRHSGICGATDEAVYLHKKEKIPQKP